MERVATPEQLKAAANLAKAREAWMRDKTQESREAYIAANRRFREVCTLKEVKVMK